MTPREYSKRQARIHAGRCPRCNKLVNPWPLRRPDYCGNGVVCLRNWHDIHAVEKRLMVREVQR